MQRVIDLGNCGFDQSRLHALLKQHFAVIPISVDSATELQREIDVGSVALVLVNRVLDRDGSDGLAILQELSQSATTNTIPRMLISNYPEYQAAAIAAGAQPGFGKNDLGCTAWIELLGKYLSKKS